jgi:predicted ATPase
MRSRLLRPLSSLLLRRRHSSTATPLAAAWESLVSSGRVKDDPSQYAAVKTLAELQRVVVDEQESQEAAAGVFLWGKVGSGKSMVTRRAVVDS